MVAGCHCANGNLTILPDGTVMACRRTEGSVLGSIFTDDLMALWDQAKRTYRQYDKYAGCSRCRLSPWCRGCPAVAYGTTGDFFIGATGEKGFAVFTDNNANYVFPKGGHPFVISKQKGAAIITADS